jgi:AsmA family
MLRDSQTDEDARLEDAEFEGHPEFDPEDFEPRAFTAPDRKRVVIALALVIALVCVVMVPPLISVNHFRRQIARSISESLGRPVHMESVTLDILPWPGFTLKQFVVNEDPAFGSEPVIRADTVRARIRLRSLWRRRVEFSRITLDEPSVNLVHRADGRWNIESILLQASKIAAAPTAATSSAGDSPRFPYISATSGRVNFKMGLEKMPISLTEADFALWLPDAKQWQLRMEGRPTRTDTAATDNGTVRVQGSFGRAAALKDAPVDLTAEWQAAPLGAVSWILMGRDAGFRGEMTLRASVNGTVGENTLQSQMELTHARLAEFVPAQPLDAEIGCTSRTSRVFHQFSDVRCVWPVESDKPGLLLTGQVPDVQDLSTAKGAVALRKIPAETLLDGLRLGTPRVAPGLNATGKFGGDLDIAGLSDNRLAGITGSLMVTEAVLTLNGGAPFVDGGVSAEVAPGEVTVRPIGLKLGAPAPASLDAHIDRAGYTMHLSGAAMRTRLLEFAAALPQFGDGLAEALPPVPDETESKAEAPIRVDLAATHPWGGAQSWTPVAAERPTVRHKGSRRR